MCGCVRSARGNIADDCEHRNRNDKQNNAERNRPLRVAALQLEKHRQRHGLCGAREAPREGNRRSEFAERARPGEQYATHDRRRDRRQRDMSKNEPRACAERGRGRFNPFVTRSQRAINSHDQKGKRDKRLSHDDSGRRERQLKVEPTVEPLAHHAAATEREQQRYTTDHGREHHRQGDRGADKCSGASRCQHGDRDTHDKADESCNRRRLYRKPQRGTGVIACDIVPECRPRCPLEQRDEWDNKKHDDSKYGNKRDRARHVSGRRLRSIGRTHLRIVPRACRNDELFQEPAATPCQRPPIVRTMDGGRAVSSAAARRASTPASDDGAAMLKVSPTLVTRAAADLLDAIEQGTSPLRAISDALTDLADAAGARRAVASVDHATLGRQIFCSHRAPLADASDAIFGDQCLRLDPPAEIERNAERALLSATRLALGPLADSTVQHRRRSRVLAVREALIPAVANAVRNDWAFTFALVHCDRPHELTDPIPNDAHRSGDTIMSLDDQEFAVVLPMTSGPDVTAALANLAHRLSLPTLSYGVVQCPSEAATIDDLLRTAAERLAATLALRDDAPTDRSSGGADA